MPNGAIAALQYEAVIGLEVHVQLRTASKIFCGCPTGFGAAPNTNICPVCLGLPGALPVLNRRAVELAVLAAKALDCRVNETSVFARKNYFYPDLPKGYQITQFDRPLAEQGAVEIRAEGGWRQIGITRVHMEEDAGKSVHDVAEDGSDWSSIDLNRAGVPLIEIVSEPEISSPEEAYEYLVRLKEILLHAEVSDCNMEEGSLRCDANISVRPRGQQSFGAKVEIKNVNSFRFIKQALAYEIERQVEVLTAGGEIVQETRLYDPSEGRTYAMRSKEEAHDYRYFPEPDLRPLVVSGEWRAEIMAKMPELPEARRRRLVSQYGIPYADAQTLTATKARADWFEAAAEGAKSPKRLANLMLVELLGRLHARGWELEQSPISMAGLVRAADLLEEDVLSSKMLKDLFDKCFERGKGFGDVYESEKPEQISDVSALETIVDEVIASNPKQLAQFRSGKTAVLGYFVGQVMKASKGQANPALVNEILQRKLKDVARDS